MKKTYKMDTIKKKFLENLSKCKGTISTACKMSGIARSTFYDYINSDKEFMEMVFEIKELSIDYVESKLMQKIDDGDTTAIIFYLKTKGRKRGYGEKLTIEETARPIHLGEIDLTMLLPSILSELTMASGKIHELLTAPAKEKPDWLK